MKTLAFLLAVASTGALAVATPAAGGQLPASVGLDLTTQHVWRGLPVANKFSVQPNAALDVTGTGFGLELWGSFAAQDRDVLEQTDRVDITARYERSLGALWKPLSFSAGYTEYTFPNGIEGYKHTGEAFLGATASLPIVSANLSVHRDLNLFEGTYVKAGFSPPASLLSAVPIPGLDLQVNVGMSDYTDSWALQDVTSTLSFSVPFLGLASAGPYVGFSYASDDAIAGTDWNNSNFWAGVAVEVSP